MVADPNLARYGGCAAICTTHYVTSDDGPFSRMGGPKHRSKETPSETSNQDRSRAMAYSPFGA